MLLCTAASVEHEAGNIYIDIVPVNNYITSGLWRINFIPDKIRTGFFDMWLPAAASLNSKTGFTRLILPLLIRFRQHHPML